MTIKSKKVENLSREIKTVTEQQLEWKSTISEIINLLYQKKRELVKLKTGQYKFSTLRKKDKMIFKSERKPVVLTGGAGKFPFSG